jgi:SAM-dependent methyltransferase
VLPTLDLSACQSTETAGAGATTRENRSTSSSRRAHNAAMTTDWREEAAWYDVFNPWGTSDDFYLDLVMSADRVLDVGCGTGTLLRRALDNGHPGRLCGLDPDRGRLARAQEQDARAQEQDDQERDGRERDGIEWVLGDAASARWDGEFDLAVMTGHAFQELVADDVLRASLQAIHDALADGGRFAFETRDPRRRPWEHWDGMSFTATNPEDGGVVAVSYQVLDVTGDVVTTTETMSGQWWDEPQVGHGTMRFLSQELLAWFLDEAGFEIKEQYGDWARGPITGTTGEIITVAGV